MRALAPPRLRTGPHFTNTPEDEILNGVWVGPDRTTHLVLDRIEAITGDNVYAMSFTLPGAQRNPDQQAADLLTSVQGVGPGSSSTAKVQQIQASLAAHDTTAACSQLGAFINEVQVQTGKKIPAGTARSLIDAA